MSDEQLIVNGVQFETKAGAMVAWRRTQGDATDVLFEVLLDLCENHPVDFAAFGAVEKAWINSLTVENSE